MGHLDEEGLDDGGGEDMGLSDKFYEALRSRPTGFRARILANIPWLLGMPLSLPGHAPPPTYVAYQIQSLCFPNIVLVF